jgi:YegS/Rv2252/BmrU family lipid kinase
MEGYEIAGPVEQIHGPFQQVHIIVNPTSGTDAPPVEEIKAHFEAAGLALQLHETQPEVTATALARKAVEMGADLVIACGGDGTVLATAEGLAQTQVPMGIIPQGTANVFGAEMGLPLDLASVLALFTTENHRLRQIDMGQVNSQAFLLRLGVGWEAAMTVLTPSDLKERYGRWAYLMTALRVRRRLTPVRYRLVIDGEIHTARGVSCLICNSGNVGLSGLKLLPEIEVDDGQLNVVIIRRADLSTLLSLGIYVLRCALFGHAIELYPPHTLTTWQGQHVELTVEPKQVVARDGEVVEDSFPFNIQIRPGVLQVVAPQPPKSVAE